MPTPNMISLSSPFLLSIFIDEAGLCKVGCGGGGEWFIPVKDERTCPGRKDVFGEIAHFVVF